MLTSVTGSSVLSAVAAAIVGGGIGNVANSFTTSVAGTFNAVGNAAANLVGLILNTSMTNLIQGLS
jgi:hypothetical protein